MKLKLDGSLRKQAVQRFGAYTFYMGVENKRHKKAKPANKFGHKNFAGGKARKTGKPDDISIAEIAEEMLTHTGVNYWTDPFQRRSSAIIKFSDGFFKLIFGKFSVRRAENLLQAVVRNPFLRRDYGLNTVLTAQIKGFNRLGIDTGQFFSAIKARIHRKGKRVV